MIFMNVWMIFSFVLPAVAVLAVSLEEQLYEVGESTAIDRHLAVLICAQAGEIERNSPSFVTLSTVNGTAIGGYA